MKNFTKNILRYKLRVKLPRFCFAKSPLQNLKGIYYPHIISSSHHLIISSILLFAFCLPTLLFAQNFDTYFENKTLRLDYLHVGDVKHESIEPVTFWQGGVWSGTHTQLIEPARLGEMVLTVKDAQNNTPIYTRSYSTLFGEWVTTENAETEIGKF